MSTLYLDDGRVVTGLIEKETDSAYIVRTVNELTVIAKTNIDAQKLSNLSLMPEGQLDELSQDDLRDLIAYLASPTQVPLPRILAPIDKLTGKVPGAIEGESIKNLVKSDGNTQSQSMANFKADRWSGNGQLWWTGQKVGSVLELDVAVPEAGLFSIEVVLTRARDYGIVELFLGEQPLGGPIDCYVADTVDTTGVLKFDPVELSRGQHRIRVRVAGKHPDSAGTMFGLDYIRFAKPTHETTDGKK